jgi:hypothetical protein
LLTYVPGEKFEGAFAGEFDRRGVIFRAGFVVQAVELEN